MTTPVEPTSGHGVVVVGSANADLVLRVADLPGPGETLLATATSRLPGGKGANQAVAAARAGASTTLIGAIGDDADGRLVHDALAAAGVDVRTVRTSTVPTGVAVVLLDDRGQNSIVVAPGANATIERLLPFERDVIGEAAVLLCQLEVPLPVIVEAAQVARAAGRIVVVNAAPSQALPDVLVDAVDVLVVNEHEAREIAGTANLDRAVDEMLTRVPAVVVTLGESGARVAERSGPHRRLPAPAVHVVDTTGAGDTFCGVLAASLAGGESLAASAERAIAAASISVQRLGAIPSIPDADEIAAALTKAGMT
ncbi:MAG TPA: ribokinase [Micromonosporaceae bacterium]|nr:ribokinase [Micromonosporaceae bacterium]